MSSSHFPSIISKSRVFPHQKSSLPNLKLSVSDLPMLSCQYIQKGVLFTTPPLPSDSLISLLKTSLSHALTHFPPLAGRLITDSSGHVYITCNDAGVDFIHANAINLSLRDVLSPLDVPASVKGFFTFDGAVSYNGHFQPLVGVQVTELSDGVFIGCTVNHAVTDGTSFWNFFNTWAEVCRGVRMISRPPDFCRNFVKDSLAVLRLPEGGPKPTFSVAAPLRERIFHFSREAILDLKSRANGKICKLPENQSRISEIMGKQSNDELKKFMRKTKPVSATETLDRTVEISSFQSLSAQLWRSVTRGRKLNPTVNTTFRMAVNCRQRLEPKMDPYYFGNAIQSIPTVASVGEILSKDLRWSAGLLNKNVVAHGDATVRRGVEDWEKEPRCFPLGNFDGASITMGSSPRFPMYDNDMGWGRPMAVRSGRANKFDGKISAFPGREGNGTVDLEVCLAPDTMAALETDTEFMQYVTTIS
ncbi:putative acetyltransferase At3g50280 [Tasmannia lanceolata]|uniref:putative acetyltransferase At3g50280 n=1 Tax=Tasmannia lanceolata TaxID=3420 RepID=UPI004064A2B0